MRKLFFLLSLSFVFSLQLQAQKPKKPTSSEIYERIEKLNFLGSALYIAAHPDDENTALISYLSNDVHARTAYLSLTRGDGGQNLVGSEIRELLGVIRTQELLGARRIDGGNQLFTRANDFGYSKNPEETLEIWEKDKVLSDVVWAIRNFRPDVIINRFDHRSPGTTHGHHTSSAMLSVQAFDLVNDPDKFPEQLEYTSTWQPIRQFFNTSWWFYGSRENFEKADKSNLISVEVGGFYPNMGLSNTEISALSRSQHKSQGFGNTGSRGSQTEYLELLHGDYPKNGNMFEGIDTSWNRIKGGNEIGKILNKVQDDYDFNNPAASLPALLKGYDLITKLEDSHWKKIKTEEIKDVIKYCAGLYIEAVTNQQTATADEAIKVSFEAINRSDFLVELIDIKLLPSDTSIDIKEQLTDNTDFNKTVDLNTGKAKLTTAYWLKEKGSLGMYKVKDQELIGKPETPHEFKAVFNLKMNGIIIPFNTDLVYKYNDRVDGEVYEPFEIIPPVSASIKEPVIIFATAEPRQVSVNVTSYQNNLNASIRLDHPKGWNISPTEQQVKINQKGEIQTIQFTVTPPAENSQGILNPEVNLNGKTYTDKVVQIDYEHIPLQTLVLPSETNVVRLNIERKGDYIGYINGAGDVVPESLEQIGYQVATISPDQITPALLEQFDAIVVGIRAYNTVDELKFKQPILLDYVEKGGTMIVQYNTSGGMDIPNLGPYPLALSRDRVTDENAEVSILDPENELLNYPNKIDSKDFKGWVQERGLYFPNEWDKAYVPIFSMHDKNENEKNGSLLIAKYGKGNYIYTGLSFFRELPAGVPGAYRLFANMLSVGKNNEKIKG